MFEYLISFSRILIYMWIKRYVMEILWQRLPYLSIYGGPEITYSNAVVLQYEQEMAKWKR